MSSCSPIMLARLLACLLLAAVMLQPILAGQYFAGNASAMDLHGPLGELVAWLAGAQALAAAACWWTGRMGLAPVVVCIGLFALAGLQVHAGHNGTLGLHIPLGSFLLVTVTLTTIWLVKHGSPEVRPQRGAA